MDILWKSVIGGLVTGLIVWLARQGDVLPGIVPLFPTFTLIALIAVGTKGDPDGFRQTCLAAAKTLPAYLGFLLTAYLMAGRANVRVTLLVALLVWLVVAVAIFAIPRLSGS